jgi:hypothetical protein
VVAYTAINFVKVVVVPLLFCLSKKEAEPGRKKDKEAIAPVPHSIMIGITHIVVRSFILN